MSAVEVFRLPDVGEGLVEAEIVSWRVRVGDTVAVNDPLLEIETAKSLVELPSPYAGIVRELLVAEGDTVRVGTPVIAVDAGGGPEAGSSVAARTAVLVGYGPKADAAVPGRRRPRRMPVSPGDGNSATGVVAPAAGKVLAKPPVRKLAKDLGLDLAGLPGSGADGVITRDDVLAGAGGSTTRVADHADSRRIPVRGVRKAIADAMTASAFTAPHGTVFLTVDVTRSVKLVKKLRQHPSFTGSRVTMLLLAARALVAGADEFPDLNASFDAEAGEIVMHPRINLGIATAGPRGLLVPNVKDAGPLSLPALAAAVTELVDVTRSGRAGPAQLTGGTITLTNIGVFGVDTGTPILNPGESAILCLGAVRRTPAEHKGRIALRWTTQLALSFDHRLIDGELGSRALSRIAAPLIHPLPELLL